MASVEDGLQSQIRNIEATYGKTMPEWFALIAGSGKTKHTEVVAWLKGEYGMTHGAAHRVSLLARTSTAAPGLRLSASASQAWPSSRCPRMCQNPASAPAIRSSVSASSLSAARRNTARALGRVHQAQTRERAD